MRVLYIRLAAIALMAAASAAAQAPLAPDTGDFRVGDRIVLAVEGEQQLSNTFTVGAGPSLALPVIGTVSLAGVRRPSLESYLTGVIDQYVRNAVVHPTSTVQLGVMGEVQRPGFYAIPSDGTLSDALMAAGGPTQSASLDGLALTRPGAAPMPRDSVQGALARNGTLVALGLHSGDQLLVPRTSDFERTARIIGVLVAVPAAILAAITFRR